MERLVMPRTMWQEMVEHARAWHPKEACGLVGGTAAGETATATLFIPCRNVLDSPVHYEIDPRDILRTMRRLDEEGLKLVAIFHSHPATRAYPSATDVAEAHYPDAVYLICSLQDLANPVINGYRIQHGEIGAVAIDVQG